MLVISINGALCCGNKIKITRVKDFSTNTKLKKTYARVICRLHWKLQLDKNHVSIKYIRLKAHKVREKIQQNLILIRFNSCSIGPTKKRIRRAVDFVSNIKTNPKRASGIIYIFPSVASRILFFLSLVR